MGITIWYNDAMPRKKSTPVAYVQPYRYTSPNIPLVAIRRFARRIAARFHPEKIILFGSYAYGNPTRDSDFDFSENSTAHSKTGEPEVHAL